MSSVFAGACFEERRGYLDTFRRCFFVDFLLTEWPCHQTLSFTTGIAQQFEISTAIPIHQTVCSSMYRMSHSAPALFQIRPSLDVYPFTLPPNHFLPPPEPRMPSSPFSRSTPQPANHLFRVALPPISISMMFGESRRLFLEYFHPSRVNVPSQLLAQQHLTAIKDCL